MIRTIADQTIEVRSNMRGGPGSVTIRTLMQPADFGAKCRLCAEMTIPPGSGIGEHCHDGEDEIYIVQKGGGILNDNGVEKKIVTGDTIITGKGATHSVLNTGTTDLVIIAVIMLY